MSLALFIRFATILGLYPPAAAQPGGSIEAAWPVGSVFISMVATNPAELLGFGTWEARGAGRVLVGLDAGDEDFDEVGAEAGAKTVAAAGSNSAPGFTGSAVDSELVSAGTPAGTVSQPTFSGDALGAHQHGYSEVVNHTHAVTVNDAGHTHTQNAHTHVQDAHTHTQNSHNHTQDAHSHGIPAGQTDGDTARVDKSSVTADDSPAVVTSNATATNQAATAVNQNATAVNQNATAVNQSNTTGITASSANPAGGVAAGTTTGVSGGTPAGTVSQPTFSGAALGAHKHSVTAAGSVAAPAFTGSPTSVVQPYLVARFWERVA